MKKVWVLMVSLLLTGGMALAQSPSPAQEESLGELARKLRSKKPKGEPEKVYTNDDLARIGRGRISVVGREGAAPTPASAGEKETAEAPATSEAAPTAAAAGPTAPAEQKGEEYWRAKFTEVRNKIALAEKEVDLLQRELQLERVQYSQDPNEAMRQQYLGQQAGGRLNELQQKIEAKQAEIARYQQELANLENELRRAGGNPGWARP